MHAQPYERIPEEPEPEDEQTVRMHRPDFPELDIDVVEDDERTNPNVRL